MKIAIASGKGGTGKTTVASNLAYVVAETGQKVRYLDCDVEEPNGHLFLNPILESSRSVGVPVPRVDADKCTGCGLCSKICQYSAIVCINKKVLTFPELCHGCGGCVRVCPEEAITEEDRDVGVVEKGIAEKIKFIHGKLRIGEAMSPPLIRAVKENLEDDWVNFIDVPPGTSCPVITAVQNSDFVLLVTEPTPFGLNDLGLALEMIQELGLKHAVVVNRHEDENISAREFCNEHDVPIIAEIPDDRRVAVAYSRGELASNAVSGYDKRFAELWQNIQKTINKS
jgi:MinD superfamily P-loop ATPase